jgi:hypothetical protein
MSAGIRASADGLTGALQLNGADVVTFNSTGLASGFPTSGNVPVGTIIDFAGASAPTGYLVCPQAATSLNKVTYAALYAALGSASSPWGSADAFATTFYCPWFPADYAAVQANSNVGTNSVGAVISHSHNINYTGNLGGGSTAPNLLGSGTTVATTATGGAANYPAGVRVLKCVRYI